MTPPSPPSFPVIDLSPNTSDQELVDRIAEACSTYGFFQVTSHGIDNDLIQAYQEQCELYFQLPHETKLQWKRHERNSRGFFDDELTKQRRDWKEALDFGVPGSRKWTTADDDTSNLCLDGWNQLPSEDVLPNFRSVVTKYFDACAKLSDKIAVLMAKGIGQDESTPVLRGLRERHSSYLRSNYYPTCNETAEDGIKPLGVSPHKDAGFLTVLLQDIDCHSLQVWKGEQWITIEPVPGAFTINTGDMAEVWSNGKYRANLHRVLSHGTKVRYSSPFFYNPPYDALVAPLSSDPIFNPVLWGYFRAVRFAGDLTDLGVEIQIEDFLRDKNSKHFETQKLFQELANFKTPFSVETFKSILL
ncbi:MAG: hypothetical protein SGBAC_002881 [Bacillariaceae sp.]